MVLAEELFEDVLKPAIFPKAQDLIDEARRAGCRIVLVTGALDFTILPAGAAPAARTTSSPTRCSSSEASPPAR